MTDVHWFQVKIKPSETVEIKGAVLKSCQTDVVFSLGFKNIIAGSFSLI